MRKYSLLWLLLGWTVHTYAQTITIKDQETNDPLELVTLISDSDTGRIARVFPVPEETLFFP